MPGWLVKPRRSPSQHSRHARVYCNMTKTVHNLSTPPYLPRVCHIRFFQPFFLWRQQKYFFWPTSPSMTEAMLTCPL